MKITFPDGKRFAFSIVDDTDVATVATVKPVYDALERSGLKTTKTIWMKRLPSQHYSRSETIEDPAYAEFVSSLHRKGFEIAFHGASMESSDRATVIDALERFKGLFGTYPRVHVNHANNQDNLYWGADRFSSALLRGAVRWRWKRSPAGSDRFQGQNERSPFFWGDLCRDRIQYVRNFCFEDINQAAINPSQPYHDPRCKYVNYWFSGLDAPEVDSFNRLLTDRNLDKLEREGGVCIVATHFGVGFVRDGRLSEGTERILESLSRRPGWYVPVSTLLDHLRAQPSWRAIGPWELLQLQLRWLVHRVRARGSSPL